MRRITEVSPFPGNGGSGARQPNKFDDLGDPVVKDLPGYKVDMKINPSDFRDGDSSASSDTSDRLQGVADVVAKHCANLVSKHGARLTAICGKDVVAELAAMSRDSEPVKESAGLFDFTDSPFIFKEPGDFARRYR